MIETLRENAMIFAASRIQEMIIETEIRKDTVRRVMTVEAEAEVHEENDHHITEVHLVEK